MTNQNSDMTKYLSICCSAEKKVAHGDEGTSHFQCSKCGKEYFGAPTPQPDKATDLERLIEDFMRDCVMGNIHVDEHTYWAEPPTPQEVRDIIKEAYKAGARAHAKATSLLFPKYIVVRPDDTGDIMTAGYEDAMREQRELSDQFFNNINI